MSDPKANLRKIWGFLLFAAGFGMFFTIPQRVMEFQAKGKYFFGMEAVLYLISVLLIVGGGKKIFQKMKAGPGSDANPEN
jgi:peptidoglycan/LPS O-acetylase OafA/YrhL